MKVYQSIARKMNAITNCVKSGNTEWEVKHADHIEEIVKNQMPSGSGIDTGTKFDFAKSTENKLIFTFEYHHMNDSGMYDGWTNHVLTIKPSLTFGFDMTISGSNRNQIKDYLYEVYRNALEEEVNNKIA